MGKKLAPEIARLQRYALGKGGAKRKRGDSLLSLNVKQAGKDSYQIRYQVRNGERVTETVTFVTLHSFVATLLNSALRAEKGRK